MKLARKLGSTSQILQIFIQDSSSTTGAGLTGLTNGSSGLTAYYHRDTDTTATAISLVSMTVGTFTSSGFKEIDATNMPGWYQFCPPDAAFAAGATSVGFHLKGATNMAPLPIEIDLDAQVDLTNIAGQAVTAAAGVTFPSSIASPTNITAGTITTVTNLTNAPTSGDLTATMKASVATAVLTTQMTESYAAFHTAPTLAQAIFETRALLAENSVSGTTVTVKKIDGSTTAETFTIDSATAPTSITRAT